jgi:hypothetical protein
MQRALLVINFAATWYMVGLIWFVQVVHYPLFAMVARDNFVKFEEAHSTLTTLVVGPPMLIELATAVLLVALLSASKERLLAAVALGLLVVVWFSTALLQVPLHGKLSAGFDQTSHTALVTTNWIRTVCWSLRGLIVGYLLFI